MKIISFENEIHGVISENAILSQDTFSKNVALPFLMSQGYSGDAEGIVSKNSQTGEEMPEAQKTVRWSPVFLSPDGGHSYWIAPEKSSKYVDWRDFLTEEMLASGLFPESIDLPDEWVVVNDED